MNQESLRAFNIIKNLTDSTSNRHMVYHYVKYKIQTLEIIIIIFL